MANQNLKNILSNLNVVCGMHIVPGWQWTDLSWQKFRRNYLDVEMFHDDIGNVYLNCSSLDALKSKLKNGDLVVLQAHLDHPGGTVIASDVHGEAGLYAACWLGRYSATLEGKNVTIAGTDGTKEELFVDADLMQLDERIMCFRSDKRFSAGATIHYPGEVCSVKENGGVVAAYNLDDAINVAVLLDVFSSIVPPNVIGLLTIGEEYNERGIRYFRGLVDSVDEAKKPRVINLEAPAENEANDFSVGDGVVVRTGDNRSLFSDVLCEKLAGLLQCKKSLHINSGQTEVSFLSKAGWLTSGLAIPVRYAHNGSSDGMWRDEEVAIKDVLDMHDAVTNIVCKSNSLNTLAERYGCVGGDAEDAINIVDEAGDVVSAIRQSNDYSEFLSKALVRWNEINKKYNIQAVHISPDEFHKYQDGVMGGKIGEIDLNELKYLSKESLKKVENELSIYKQEALNIYIMFARQFNAKRVGDGVALSVLQYDSNELERILCHEIVHWLTDDAIAARYVRRPISAIISEGMACYVSAKICGLTDSQALSLNDDTCLAYDRSKTDLKKRFKIILDGAGVNITGRRHRIISKAKLFSPFTISKDNPHNKYGYFLGLDFIKTCVSRGLSLQQILYDHVSTNQLLQEYLNEETI